MRLISVPSTVFLLLFSTSCIVYPSNTPIYHSPAVYTPPSASASDFQSEFLRRINEVRAKGCTCGGTFMPPAPPLTWNTQLQYAALLHARDMNKKKYFSHINREGKSSKDRILESGYSVKGYRSFTVGENIAWGQRSIREVMDGWIKSAGHCRNLMNRAYSEVGIAMENYYWVQDFGGRVK